MPHAACLYDFSLSLFCTLPPFEFFPSFCLLFLFCSPSSLLPSVASRLNRAFKIPVQTSRESIKEVRETRDPILSIRRRMVEAEYATEDELKVRTWALSFAFFLLVFCSLSSFLSHFL